MMSGPRATPTSKRTGCRRPRGASQFSIEPDPDGVPGQLGLVNGGRPVDGSDVPLGESLHRGHGFGAQLGIAAREIGNIHTDFFG